MKANATIFDTDDLDEPFYSGQIFADSYPTYGRRIFRRISDNEHKGLWQDNYGFVYEFSDLKDIVIINKGVKEL